MAKCRPIHSYFLKSKFFNTKSLALRTMVAADFGLEVEMLSF